MLKTFCCCCPLRTGCIVCGILNLIISLVFVGLLTYYGIINVEDNNHRWIYLMYLTVAAINVLVSAVLIFGATREKKWFLLPWFIFNSVALAMSSIMVPYYSTINIRNALFFIPLVISWYLWMTVFSHFRELIKWEEEKQESGLE